MPDVFEGLKAIEWIEGLLVNKGFRSHDSCRKSEWCLPSENCGKKQDSCLQLISRDRLDPEIPADSDSEKERCNISSCSHNSCHGNGVRLLYFILNAK